MIVLDTSILVYAVGGDDRHRHSCREVVAAIRDRKLAATTTFEVIQEFVHVRSRRRPRSDAVSYGREFVELLQPLIAVDGRSFEIGLNLYESEPASGAFDCMLAAAATVNGCEGLLSADTHFVRVTGLRHYHPIDDLGELTGQNA
ncbi:MAG: PIN domain-containing protein [Dehalococcoidia bacterium]